jgi:hypothetical protein
MLVVDLDDPDVLVGMLAMSDVVRAHARAASNADSMEDDAVDADERRQAVAWTRHDTSVEANVAPATPRPGAQE